MKKKIMITVASLAALGAAVAGYLHFSGRTPFGHRQYEMTPSLVKRGFTCHT